MASGQPRLQPEAVAHQPGCAGHWKAKPGARQWHPWQTARLMSSDRCSRAGRRPWQQHKQPSCCCRPLPRLHIQSGDAASHLGRWQLPQIQQPTPGLHLHCPHVECRWRRGRWTLSPIFCATSSRASIGPRCARRRRPWVSACACGVQVCGIPTGDQACWSRSFAGWAAASLIASNVSRLPGS